MSNVTALARGPLSRAEALVMYATAVEDAARGELSALTGLPEMVIDDAIAQLVRRGLIRTNRHMRHTATGEQRTRRLRLIDSHTHPKTPPTAA